MEIKVLTEGKLKNGKIEINGQNFYLMTVLPKDNELKNNYIGTNIKQIEFNEMNNGTQKMLFGIVRSGDYINKNKVAEAIGNNINNYSKTNTIVFTGTYVNENNEEIEIRKEIPLEMDWYGKTATRICTSSETHYDLPDRIDEENGTLNLSFYVDTEETQKELLLSKNVVQGTIPELEGYSPVSVTCSNNNVEFTYDETTRKFTITRVATVDNDGNITNGLSRSNLYTVNVTYPIESYVALDSKTVTISIPVEEYYEGYNNQNSEFSNPYKSNVAKSTILATFTHPREYGASIEVQVGKYATEPSYRYYVSKKKPLRIYNQISEKETDDIYDVRWYVYTGTNGQVAGATIKETPDGETQQKDTFIKTDSTEISMEELTTNVGIGFSNVSNFLNEDGWIKVYDDETGILLETFEKADWGKYNQ